MEHANDQKKRSGVHGMCGTMADCRRGMPWCGFFLVIAGLLWLIVHSGWLATDLFWPVLMVLMGTWMILPPFWRKMVNSAGERTKP
jgi:hypothetical protein